MRRFAPTLAALGLVLLGACTDSPSRGPTAPGSVRPDYIAAGQEADIQNAIGQLLAGSTGLRNAAQTQFANVTRSAGQSKFSVAVNQAGALVNFLLKQSSAGKVVGFTANPFTDGPAQPTADVSLSQTIAAIYAYLNRTVPAGTELAKIDAAAVMVPATYTGTDDIVVKTGTGLAAVRIPKGALGVDALVTITPIPFEAFAPGSGPLIFSSEGPSLTQVPYFYDVSAYPVNGGSIASPFNSQVTVEVCQVETGPYAVPEATHGRLQLAHNVGGFAQLLTRTFGGDLACVPSVPVGSVGALPRPMESEGLLAMGLWQLRTLPARALDALTPTSAYAGHGGLGGLTSSFSPFGAVDPGPITISPTSFSVGQSIGYFIPSDDNWSCPAYGGTSSNPAVGSFDSGDGIRFVAHAVGQTTITVQCYNSNANTNQAVTQVITVVAAAPPPP